MHRFHHVVYDVLLQLVVVMIVQIILKKMENNILKIKFQTEQANDTILWENHVDEIINGIERGEHNSFKVYMKNLMPISEMDNVAKELCDTIKWHFNCEAKYVRHNECIAAGHTDMLASAAYYIEFIH